MNKSLKTLIIVVIIISILLIATLGMVVYLFINMNNNTTNTTGQNGEIIANKTEDLQISDIKNSKQESELVNESPDEITESLTLEELQKITAFLNKRENNGFLESNYNKPEEIDIYNVLMVDHEKYITSTTEKIEYIEEKWGEVVTEEEIEYYITSPVFKVTITQIKALIKEKTGVEFTNAEIAKSAAITGGLTLSKSDVYWMVGSDDLLSEINCISGTKTGNTYVIEYKAKDTVGTYILEGKVTLTKVNDKYLFVANKVSLAY